MKILNTLLPIEKPIDTANRTIIGRAGSTFYQIGDGNSAKSTNNLRYSDDVPYIPVGSCELLKYMEGKYFLALLLYKRNQTTQNIWTHFTLD